MYVLVRESDGKYVAVPGLEKSYTTRLEDAQTFATEDAAHRNSCIDSERVVAVSDLLRKPTK